MPNPSDRSPLEHAQPGPVLALDVGQKRTGIARSDPGRTLAFGLPTFQVAPGRSLKRHLESLFQEEPFSGVVLGIPFHADGKPGELSGRIRRLGTWIEEAFQVPVAYQDEGLTTEEALDLMKEAPRRVRGDKGRRDQLAAQVILREFLARGCPFGKTGDS